MQKGDTIELTIEDLAFGGSGVGRAGGLVVMVRGGLPGDRVSARIHKKASRYLEAQALEILTPSPLRRPPPCRHAAVCGGCPLMPLDDEEQTRRKGDQAVDIMARIGRFRPLRVEPPLRPGRAFSYRNKMEFTFSPDPWPPGTSQDTSRRPEGAPALGLHPTGRYDRVFDVEDCLLPSPLINRILQVLRAEAARLRLTSYVSRSDQGLLRHVITRTSRHWPDVLVALVVRDWDARLEEFGQALRRSVPAVTGCVVLVHRSRATVARGEEERLLWGRPVIRETVRGFDWTVGASSFFQTSTEGAEILAEKTLAWAEPAAAETAVDLYCGVGALTLPMARRTSRVVGVDCVWEALRAGRDAAARSGLGNAAFVEGLVEDVLTPPDAGPNGLRAAALARLGLAGPPDLVVVDPPRGGFHPKALPGLIALGPRRILYISCNPSTQARDAAVMISEGYEPRRFQALDLFPQTPHVETLLLLVRP